MKWEDFGYGNTPTAADLAEARAVSAEDVAELCRIAQVIALIREAQEALATERWYRQQRAIVMPFRGGDF